MSTADNTFDDGATPTVGTDGESFRLRSYQAEMVNESLTSNIIVAMDTGSGKTHIALARTAAELERCQPNQLVWFLVPTVALCNQQHRVFQEHLQAYGVRALSGSDIEGEHWTDQNTWDSVLENIRVVLSTHQVLLDALTHAFVKMSRLALIIFDEAHHCIENHPSNRIMKHFYTPLLRRNGGIHIPKVLGLSASPAMRARASHKELEILEKNMNAIAKSPKMHRSELLRFVHLPELVQVQYPKLPPGDRKPPLLLALTDALHSYDMKADPYVIALEKMRMRGEENSIKALYEVFTRQNTYCRNLLKDIVRKGHDMLEELGASPTEWYLKKCISEYLKVAQGSNQQILTDLSSEEKTHLCKILRKLPLSQSFEAESMSLDNLSPKTEALLDVLVSQATSKFTGLVFVEQRVWVAALSEILSLHPRTASLFNVGTFLGTSNNQKRKIGMADLAEPRNQQDTLDSFREGGPGQINLILATSVLEEGIDVSSCHIVICFESPKNLKSFVQRRGRARKQESKYIIFLPESGSHRSPEKWQELEEAMKAAYLNDMREIEAATERDRLQEDNSMFYEVPSTRALLTLDNATAHLHHFCSILGSGLYVDPRPQFKFDEDGMGGIRAEVTLPLSVDPVIRTATSSKRWLTERNAKNEAAFQAYKALHLAGLVNDNLLPSRGGEGDDQESDIPDNTPSLVEISKPFDPWFEGANRPYQNDQVYHRALLKLTAAGELPLSMLFLSPCPIAQLPDLVLHWNSKKKYSIETSPLSTTTLTSEENRLLIAITQKLLRSVFPGRMSEERDDFLWYFVPSETDTLAKLSCWDATTSETESASNLIQQGQCDPSKWGMLSIKGDKRKYMPVALKQGNGALASAPNLPQLEVIRMPKRRDFLHAVSEQNTENEAYTKIEVLNPADCVVDSLPVAYSVFALFIPSIVHRYELYMLAETLRTTILRPVEFHSSDLSMIISAVTSSNTGEEDNYQRLEFLGDCILKYLASVHVMAAYPTEPEGYLTARKGRIVSNGFLARATMAAGLDRFILTKRFTGAKWQPRYAKDVLNQEAQDEKTLRSSKLLADVIESLLGASYLVGGFEKAFTCARTLLPAEDWTPIPDANAILFEQAPTDTNITSLSILQELIGYKFEKSLLLLEAITHASYTGPLVVRSYERLEFLGDAILDYIVSKRLFSHTPELSHQTMHSIRTSMANAAFLAFRMFETTVTEDIVNKETLRPEPVHRALWQFLRHNNPQLLASQAAALAQHRTHREEIDHALKHDHKFPWHLLSLTDAPKFLSDIVESVIGAVYIDSRGNVEQCESFVGRLGIIDALDRILRDGVDCLHPKEKLGHLAVEKSVQYVNVSGAGDDANPGIENGEMSGAKSSYRCQVKVGGIDVGGIVEGAKRLNAETMAAWKAVRIIEGVDDVAMDTDSDEEWHDADERGVSLQETW
ncbi:dicer-like protein 2 [Clohesyomyces aquaticus]|uniref:Dicer-like protein 2 n=1 Tax=Clohesyomyces aquaticus TaxID=1231657 RepID=A0A1Y1ZN13_9PLEO|nr:dicer-like protein 2 [Clohesyomyces aquaticus]